MNLRSSKNSLFHIPFVQWCRVRASTQVAHKETKFAKFKLQHSCCSKNAFSIENERKKKEEKQQYGMQCIADSTHTMNAP